MHSQRIRQPGRKRRTLRAARVFEGLYTYLFLGIALVIALFPLFYTFMASGKSNQDLLANPSTIIPEKFVFDNYVRAWQLANFKQYTLNSIHLASFIVVGTIITCTVAGYVFDRGRFRGKEIVFGLIISSMFV
ncbi:hypothetical protein LJC74_08680, partial [Eubacteriales bacterium OttesenSCG-928-A19]|nr:hypothetical protein [Eubacteriales bacterium OttesenSCG-928-A19]